MHAVISEGGHDYHSMLSSMHTYNANISGSDQYLNQKRKLLEGLCEQKVRVPTFNEFQCIFFSEFTMYLIMNNTFHMNIGYVFHVVHIKHGG